MAYKDILGFGNFTQSDYDMLKEEGFDDDKITQILELGLFDTETKILDRESDLATEMRISPTPKGRHVGQGRIFVAASPFEHLSRGAERYAGKRKQDKLDVKYRENAKEQVAARLAFLKGGGAGGAGGGLGGANQRPYRSSMPPGTTGGGGVPGAAVTTPLPPEAGPSEFNPLTSQAQAAPQVGTPPTGAGTSPQAAALRQSFYTDPDFVPDPSMIPTPPQRVPTGPEPEGLPDFSMTGAASRVRKQREKEAEKRRKRQAYLRDFTGLEDPYGA